MAFKPLKDTSLAPHKVAVALTHGGLGGGHVGIAFLGANSQPHMMHLNWHYKFSLDAIDDNFDGCWVVTTIDLPDTASKHLTAVMLGISKTFPKISYGINFIASKGSFIGTQYSPPEGSHGLTCASFVLEVLRAGNVELIQESTWEKTPENEQWGERVCGYLAQTQGVTSEHVAAVRASINGLRLIPYEVSGAASQPKEERPVTYPQVQPLAQEAAKTLEACCPN